MSIGSVLLQRGWCRGGEDFFLEKGHSCKRISAELGGVVGE